MTIEPKKSLMDLRRERLAEQKKNRLWIVRLEYVVCKVVICRNCTEEEARTNPYDHAVSEEEDGSLDYKVLSVEESK